MFKQSTKHFQLKKSSVPENLLLCHISDSDLKSSNAFKMLLIFISKHIAIIIGCFMIKSQICTESSFFVKDCTRPWGRMSCKPKPLPSWDLCYNRKCRLRREVNKWINGILQMPWNWLAEARNTDYMVRGDYSDENDMKRWEYNSHMQSKKELWVEGKPCNQDPECTETLIFKDHQQVWNMLKGHMYKCNWVNSSRRDNHEQAGPHSSRYSPYLCPAVLSCCCESVTKL